jgi:hypothetical protein
MGLDNYPHRYPCKTAGTAVLDGDGRIDCAATQERDGCPWKAARLGDGAAYGMFGTDCWYRGKEGQYLIAALTEAGAQLPEALENGFFGDDDYLTPDYCRQLATWMEDHGEQFLATDYARRSEHAAHVYAYAARWLRFAADHCDGAKAWW